MAPEPPAAATGAPVLVSQPAAAAPDEQRPLVKRPLFWVAVGGVVVAAVAVGLIVASSGGPKDPSPSIGKVDAN
jgi:hypothetical protein